MKKHLMSLVCAVVMVAGLAAAFYLGTKVEPQQASADYNGVSVHGALHVDGTLLKGENDETVVLRGMSSHGIVWFPRYLNGATMEALHRRGANVQRLAMYTDGHEGYVEEPELSLNYLYMGIESALAADMYVIVDWHILEDGDPNQYQEEAVAFFQEITSHYGNNPALIYEICNEPNGDTTWDDVVRYANQVIPVIRQNAPDALVLVGTPQYCTDFTGPIAEPLAFENVMYTLHRYIDTSEDEPCDNELIASALNANLPIFVSEWGTGGDQMQDEGKTTTSGDYQENALPFLEFMEENHISWTAWSLCNKDEAHSVIRSDCDELSQWEDEDLTPFGRMIFSHF